MMANTYTCEHCGGVFDSTQESTEKANDEAKQLFGVDNASTDPAMARICDECWQQFMAWHQEVIHG
jgi:Fe2+ or Zn2+ uptake regulation protein